MNRATSASLLAALLVTGCDGTARPAGTRSCERLVLAPVAPDPGLAPADVVARFDVSAEFERWALDAPNKGVAATEAVGGRPLMYLEAAHHSRDIRLVRAGHYDPATFNQVQVSFVFEGRLARLAVEFLRDGEVVATTPDEPVDVHEQLAQMAFDVPPELVGEGPLDAIALTCDGRRRRFTPVEVSLVRQPPAARLPDAAGGGELVRLGLAARRGVGLVEGRPLEVELVVPARGRLSFAYGWPGVSEVGEATLRLELSDGSGSPQVVRRPLTAEDGDAWQVAEVALDRWNHRRVRAEFSLEAEEGTPDDAACALAEVSLWTPETWPRTVVLVTSDTHRGDHIGVAGRGVDVHTPVIDALAARGCYFSDCFAPANNTNPSHVALMTGISPRDTGVLDNYSPLSDDAPTLAEAFAEQGFATLATVTTRHLGPHGSGLGQGFDRMAWPGRSGTRDSVSALEDVTRWLAEMEQRSVFLWLHLFDAHTPYEPPEDIAARYWERARDPRNPKLPEPEVPERALPRELRGVRDLRWPVAQYKGEVTAVDRHLQVLLLDERVASGVIALVSDHGEAFGEHGAWFQHLGLYPATLHVPLILAGPSVPAGVRVETPVMHMDLGRTLLDLAGLGRVPFPGRNLVELARTGQPARQIPPRFALEAGAQSASVTHDGMHLVLHLRERALPYEVGERASHEVELFDLRADPRALENLVDERPAEAAELRAKLLDWLLAAPDENWTAGPAPDAELIESLEALGYVAPAGESGSALWSADDCEWCRRFEGG